MDAFLKKFFYKVYVKKRQAQENHYCKYNDQGLAAFTSSLYLAGLVASLVASPITRKYGRRASIVCGGISFFIGAVLNAGAVNLAMLLLGRIMLGVGIGFGDQVMSHETTFSYERKQNFHSLNPNSSHPEGLIWWLSRGMECTRTPS